MALAAPRYDENVAELALLEWLGELGWQVLHGPSIAPGEPEAERARGSEIDAGAIVDLRTECGDLAEEGRGCL